MNEKLKTKIIILEVDKKEILEILKNNSFTIHKNDWDLLAAR